MQRLARAEREPVQVGTEIIAEAGLEDSQDDEQTEQHESVHAPRQPVTAGEEDRRAGQDIEDLEP
jgi:hypothetical protein